jgi:precorrin-2/cobalt-factor-2 C20-methyltransferase
VRSGSCFGVGVGPGDPELLTVKALRLVRASPVVAYFSAAGRASNARRVVSEFLHERQEELHLVYPVTTDTPSAGEDYGALLSAFYDRSAAQVAEILEDGRDVVVLCEGDPLFHGSFMYIHNRLCDRYPTEVVPGVPSILAGSAALGTPLVCLDEVLSVLSGTLPASTLEHRLAESDAAVIMKVGRNFEKVRQAVCGAGLLHRAWYVERATMAGERIMRLEHVDPATSPYFSMVVIPSSLASTR